MRRGLASHLAFIALFALLLATGLSVGCGNARAISVPTGSLTGAPTSGSTATPLPITLSSEALLESLSAAIKSAFK